MSLNEMNKNDGQFEKKYALKNVLVVYNPSSGGKSSDFDEKNLSASFNQFGLRPHFMNIAAIKTDLVPLLNQEWYCVVIMGGDGTIRSVVSYLMGKDIPLGIIPSGTYNHLAGDLNIPQELDLCLSLIAARPLRRIDVAEVNGYYFLNNSSIGLYPKAVKARKKYTLFVKWLAMTMALFNIFKQFPTFKVNYQFQGKEFEVITPLVLISNNLYKLDLLNLSERTSLNSGKLYLYINHCGSRLKFLKLFFDVLLHKRKRALAYFDIQGVEVCILTLTKQLVDVAMDGEVFRLTSPLHYKIHSGQLTVISSEKSIE